MRILYYVPDISQENGGIKQYACTLLKILAQSLENDYFILHNAQDPEILSIINGNSNLKLIPFSIGRERNIEKIIDYAIKLTNKNLENRKYKTRIKIRSRTERLCKRYKIDVVYCPYQDMPNTSYKTIATLHDVQELHYPEFFSPSQRLDRALLHKDITERSSLIVVSYEHIKKDLITYFQRTDENVIVCLLDMQSLWFDKFLPENAVSLAPYCLPKQFIFYPAVTWPHKNHIGLLKSIAYLKNERNMTIHVIFTGHKTEYFGRIEEEIIELNLKQQVHFLGVVTEDVLYALYQTTQAVVVPTMYEAGSFPLMESILMGIPVICSSATSMPDAIGDNQYVFDPKNIIDMANKVMRICFDRDYRLENIRNSERQAPKLRNTGALSKLTKVIASLTIHN